VSDAPASSAGAFWYLFDEERLSFEGRAALDDAILAGFPSLASAISIIEIVYPI